MMSRCHSHNTKSVLEIAESEYDWAAEESNKLFAVLDEGNWSLRHQIAVRVRAAYKRGKIEGLKEAEVITRMYCNKRALNDIQKMLALLHEPTQEEEG